MHADRGGKPHPSSYRGCSHVKEELLLRNFESLHREDSNLESLLLHEHNRSSRSLNRPSCPVGDDGRNEGTDS